MAHGLLTRDSADSGEAQAAQTAGPAVTTASMPPPQGAGQSQATRRHAGHRAVRERSSRGYDCHQMGTEWLVVASGTHRQAQDLKWKTIAVNCECAQMRLVAAVQVTPAQFRLE